MTRYTRSQELLSRAERLIPGGTQTFSKGRAMYPYGASPYFVTHGQGSRVWDVDGNEYIDFSNGLAAITLGYNDPDVTRAVERQLKNGVTFSLSHTLEVEVAERFAGMVPCAEMVRFGKNGSDVTAGAVRLARAYTGRDHIAACGYHGWHDWYIGATTMNRGVPETVAALTHTFAYNDVGSLSAIFEQYPRQIAAVILEPVSKTEPRAGYLEQVKQLTHANGALLIFDEMITGFRVAKGGAQEHYSVIPDLATFGKGLANGYPISALAGSASVMKLLVTDVFFSLTYGGEALSLAAALATLNKVGTQPVIQRMTEAGLRLKSSVQRCIDRDAVGDIVSISGHPAGSWMMFRDAGRYLDWEIHAFYVQEMFARGILTFGKHNMSYAHSDADIDRLLSVYDQVLPLLREAVQTSSLHERLRCEPQKPRFRVR